MRHFGRVIVIATMLGHWAWGADGKSLLVGPGRELKVPSEAAAVASDGDTIEIEPKDGGYFDCAVWKANHLTVEGKGANVVITDKTCQGKALFITAGNDITIRNITLTRARVPDKNGAGIRAEGVNLRIEHARFINNENGILAAEQPTGTIDIRDSEFIGNGKCDPNCAHGIYVNAIALLHIERCIFKDTKVGHHIKSRAARTELIGNDIEDGETGTSSYLVDIPNGGSLIMRDNVLEKGPKSENHNAAIIIGAEGVTQPTQELIISGNKFKNDMNVETTFVKNLTATGAQLTGNKLEGKAAIPLSGDGSVR
jgi:nitrous oxidase accessory protein NosD